MGCALVLFLILLICGVSVVNAAIITLVVWIVFAILAAIAEVCT